MTHDLRAGLAHCDTKLGRVVHALFRRFVPPWADTV